MFPAEGKEKSPDDIARRKKVSLVVVLAAYV